MMQNVVCLLVLVALAYAKDVSREKRDDANPITVTTILEAPYLTESTDTRATGNAKYEGIIKEMMEHISNKLKLDYKFRLVADNKYGSEESGTWTGMIGEIQSGVADMAAAPMTISEKRKAVVDFTEPFESFGTVLLMLKGKHEGITSVTDLANQDEIKYGVVKDGSTENFFRTSQDEDIKKMWEVVQNNPIDTLEDGVKKVRDSDGKFAFILESATAEYWVDKEPCDLEYVGDKINENSFAFALKKGSENLDLFNGVIKDMKTSRMLNDLRKRFKKGECGHTIEDNKSGAAATNAVASVLGVTLAYSVAVLLVL